MRRGLTDCSGLAAAGLLLAVPFAAAKSAAAAEPVKLTVGGFFRAAYMVVTDDDEEGDLGFDTNTDGLFNDAEVHFTGSTVLDNGLEVGARIELEGETDDDQIDEAWVWFSGGFGEIRIGSDDEALANACVTPPGGSANFSAFSPNQWGANGAGFANDFVGGPASNSVCTGVDGSSDAQKILYITPVFGGFQLTASYTPGGGSETHDDGAGPHLGMPQRFFGQSRNNVSVYGTYQYLGDGWGITAGAGGSWEGKVEDRPPPQRIEESEFYQAGINLNLGAFSIGAAGEYYNDFFSRPDRQDADLWIVGIGGAYEHDAWTFGLQYSHRQVDKKFFKSDLDDMEFQEDRVVATVNYALGPGINVDAELGYTWMDLDPEAGAYDFQPEDRDDYDAIEFGIGTSIAF
jgi:predicted porin